METKNEKSGIIKAVLIIVALVLVVFICWKAGWILNGNKNEVSGQEKQEAIREAVQETQNELDSERRNMSHEIREMKDEIHNALQEMKN